MAKQLTLEQQKILESDKKKLVVSASAGSGKTFVLIEVLINLICNKNVPISKLLVLTFTKAAANEMRTRLYKAVLEQKPSEFLLSQLDEIIVSDICTIDSFCEKIIKRNVSKLQIDENFNILDEKASARLKLKAFNKTFNEFFQKDKLAFENIYFAFKRNKDEIFSFVLHVNNYLDSLTEDEREKILSNDFPSALAENYLLSLINSLSQCGLKKLDDEKKEQLQSYKEQLEQANTRREEIVLNREALIQEMEIEKVESTVSAGKEMLPGVELIIGSAEFSIRQSYKAITFFEQDGMIQTEKYRGEPKNERKNDNDE